MDESKKYKSITLSKSTITKLDAIRHQGQSYDGIINEIIDQIGKNHLPLAITLLPPQH